MNAEESVAQALEAPVELLSFSLTSQTSSP
jgi:hypothetical protein